MSEWSEGEKYLLEQIRRGSSEAWSQLVERFEGRLLAFARRRAPKGADAEDLVQDTFLLFLRGLPNYREQASLETYLFLILRRRIIELLRGKKSSVCQLPESEEGRDDSSVLAAPDPTASWYVRREEHREAARAALTTALRSLVERMKEELNFRDLQVIELLFYAQWPNRQIAHALQADADHVALVKHRWLKQVRERVTQLLQHQLGRDEGALNWESPDAFDSLLTEIWEDQRLSCPKRSTIGGFLLNTLDAPWQQYVDFHLHRLGCSFCKANLDDLQKQTQTDRQAMRQRILQSTVGFFRKVSG